MFKKVKEFNENNRTLYFIITMAILIGLLFFNSLSGRKKSNECVMPTTAVNSSLIYKYQMKIKKADEVIIIDAKRNGAKYLFEKTEKGKLSSYYIYYYSIFESDIDGKYIPYSGTSFVEGLDNKMFFLDYIDDLSMEAEINKEEDVICYYNKEASVNMCIDNDNVITVTYNDITIEYTVSNIGEVSEFDVVISTEKSEEPIDEEKPNNPVQEPVKENNNNVVKEPEVPKTDENTNTDPNVVS